MSRSDRRIRRLAPDGSDSDIRLLDDAESAAIEALTGAFVALYIATPILPQADVPADLVAGLFDEPRALLAAIRTLARGVTGRVLGQADAPDATTLEAARRAVGEAQAALLGEPAEEPPPDARKEMLPHVGELIREIGLEEFDASVLLAVGRDGRPHFAWHPVPPETALIWLQGRIFDRLEAVVLGDHLLGLERLASRWVFDRWSPPLHIGDREAAAFTREVREREWSLVERETLLFGEPLIPAFCDQPAFEQVPARQQQLARALRGSFTGVFAIASRRGDDVEFERPLDGSRYRVHEHNRAIRYDPGFIAIGRLIPLGKGRWLRSPGMVIFKSRDEDAAHVYAEGFQQVRDVPPAIAAEGLLAIIAGREHVPREVPAAGSPAEAQALLQAVQETLAEHGRVEELGREDVVPELRAPAGEERHYFGYDVDADTAAWIAALSEQARRARGWRRGRGGRRAAKARKMRGKRR